MNALWIVLIVVAALIVLVTVVYIFLIAPGKVNKKDYAWLTDHYFAHRGLFTADQRIPENSMDAFARAIQAGYGMELDVELTCDDVLVVFHDDSLARMTGKEKKLWDCTYEELQQLHLAKTDKKIPLFSDFLKLVDGKVPLIIEIKNTKKLDKICSMTYDLLKDYKGLYCIESFNPFIIAWFRKHAPSVLRGQLSARYKDEPSINNAEKFILENLMLNFLARPQFIAYCYKDCDKLAFRLCKRLGAFTIAWTVDSLKAYQISRPVFDALIFEHILPGKSGEVRTEAEVAVN